MRQGSNKLTLPFHYNSESTFCLKSLECQVSAPVKHHSQPLSHKSKILIFRNDETLRSWFLTSSPVYGLRRNITFLGAMLANVYVNYSCCATFKANLGCKKWPQLQFEAHGKQIHACIRGERPAHNCPNCFQQFRNIGLLWPSYVSPACLIITLIRVNR